MQTLQIDRLVLSPAPSGNTICSVYYHTASDPTLILISNNVTVPPNGILASPIVATVPDGAITVRAFANCGGVPFDEVINPTTTTTTTTSATTTTTTTSATTTTTTTAGTTTTTTTAGPNTNWTISYTQALNIPVQVLIGNNGGSPTNTLFNGNYTTDPLTGTDATDLPANNATIVITVGGGKNLISLSINGTGHSVPGTSNTATVPGVTGAPLVISFNTN